MAHDPSPEGHAPELPLGGTADYPDKPLLSKVALPQAPAPAHEGKTPFPLIMGALMAIALVASWFSQKDATPAASPATSPAASGDKPAATAAEGPKDLKDQVAALSKRIDDLQGTLGTGKAGEPGDLDGRIGAMGKDLDGLKAEVAALKKGAGMANAPKLADAPKPEVKDVDVANRAMSDAVALFKAGKYKDASAAFGKLSQVDGNDARVWYYAALSNALASGKWKGEPETLAKKGVEREKVRSPESSKIDEVFTGLTTTTGKDWLAYFRKSAKP